MSLSNLDSQRFEKAGWLREQGMIFMHMSKFEGQNFDSRITQVEAIVDERDFDIQKFAKTIVPSLALNLKLGQLERYLGVWERLWNGPKDEAREYIPVLLQASLRQLTFGKESKQKLIAELCERHSSEIAEDFKEVLKEYAMTLTPKIRPRFVQWLCESVIEPPRLDVQLTEFWNLNNWSGRVWIDSWPKLKDFKEIQIWNAENWRPFGLETSFKEDTSLVQYWADEQLFLQKMSQNAFRLQDCISLASTENVQILDFAGAAFFWQLLSSSLKNSQKFLSSIDEIFANYGQNLGEYACRRWPQLQDLVTAYLISSDALYDIRNGQSFILSFVIKQNLLLRAPLLEKYAEDLLQGRRNLKDVRTSLTFVLPSVGDLKKAFEPIMRLCESENTSHAEFALGLCVDLGLAESLNQEESERLLWTLGEAFGRPMSQSQLKVALVLVEMFVPCVSAEIWSRLATATQSQWVFGNLKNQLALAKFYDKWASILGQDFASQALLNAPLLLQAALPRLEKWINKNPNETMSPIWQSYTYDASAASRTLIPSSFDLPADEFEFWELVGKMVTSPLELGEDLFLNGIVTSGIPYSESFFDQLLGMVDRGSGWNHGYFLRFAEYWRQVDGWGSTEPIVKGIEGRVTKFSDHEIWLTNVLLRATLKDWRDNNLKTWISCPTDSWGQIDGFILIQRLLERFESGKKILFADLSLAADRMILNSNLMDTPEWSILPTSWQNWLSVGMGKPLEGQIELPGLTWSEEYELDSARVMSVLWAKALRCGNPNANFSMFDPVCVQLYGRSEPHSWSPPHERNYSVDFGRAHFTRDKIWDWETWTFAENWVQMRPRLDDDHAFVPHMWYVTGKGTSQRDILQTLLLQTIVRPDTGVPLRNDFLALALGHSNEEIRVWVSEILAIEIEACRLDVEALARSAAYYAVQGTLPLGRFSRCISIWPTNAISGAGAVGLFWDTFIQSFEDFKKDGLPKTWNSTLSELVEFRLVYGWQPQLATLQILSQWSGEQKSLAKNVKALNSDLGN